MLRAVGSFATIGGTVSGGAANSILYVGASGLAQDNANLNYTTTSGPRLQVGSTGTSSGWTIGYAGGSGVAGMWNNALATKSEITAAIIQDANGRTQVSSVAGQILYLNSGSSISMSLGGAAGTGLGIVAGIAASAVSALSITQTWNYNAAALDGVLWTFTDTSSHANTNAFRILGGAAGTTELMTLGKTGQITNVGGITFAGNGSFDAVATNIGIVQYATRQLGIRIGSDGQKFEFNGVLFGVGSGVSVGWNSAASFGSGSVDTNASRLSAGLIGVGTGTVGSVAGGLALKHVNSYTQTTDAAPPVPLYRASNAYAQAATNPNGADLIIGPGIGRRLATVVDYSLIDAGADTITIVVNGAETIGTADAATQDGTHWVIGATNDATATNIATWMSTISGVTGAAVGASAYATFGSTVHTATIATNADAGEMTVTSGDDGMINIGAAANAAGAQTATLTNAPVAANPVVWVKEKVVIAGTLTTVCSPKWAIA